MTGIELEAVGSSEATRTKTAWTWHFVAGLSRKNDAYVEVKLRRTLWLLRHKGRHRDQARGQGT